MSVEPIAFTLVIPAFNEGDNLTPVLEDTLATLNQWKKAHPYEILIVNDGSTDHTGQVADDYARRYPCIRVFHHATNQGLGTSLRTGFTNSRGEYVSWISADGDIKADQAVKLLDIASGVDFVTTSRLGIAAEGQYKGRSLYRGILTWCMHIFCRICLGFYPTHFTGIYLIRGSYLRSLPLYSRTGLVGMEIYFQSRERNVRMGHGEIVIFPRLSGHSKVATPTGIMKSMIELCKIRWYIRKSRGITLTATGPFFTSRAA